MLIAEIVGKIFGRGRPCENWRHPMLSFRNAVLPLAGSIILEMIVTDIISDSEQWDFRVVFKTLEGASAQVVWQTQI